MTPRLASGVLVSALMRRAQGEGGSAAIIAKGDAQAGAVIVILAQRGMITGLFERAYDLDGIEEWRLISVKPLTSGSKVAEYLAQRRACDPDLWAVELDVADSERFAAEMSMTG